MRKQVVFSVGMAVVVLIVNVIVTHAVLTGPYPGHNDFLIRWEGARAYWQSGENPYSPQVSERISIMMYGHPAQPDEYPNHFLYPFYLVLELWPLVNMSYGWASAIWMVLLEVCLIGSLVLMLDIVAWRPRPVLLAGLMLWTLMDYFGARGLILGQVSHLVHFLHILSLWALFKGDNRLSGVALALATVKPTMSFLLPVFIILWALYERRWRLVGAFAVTLAALGAVAFALQPSWLGDMLDQIFSYTGYTGGGGGSVTEMLVIDYLGLSSTIALVISGGLVLGLLYVWYDVIRARKYERFLWAVTLTMVISNLAALRTGTPHYVAFSLVMVIVYLRLSIDSHHSGWGILLLVALLMLPWIQFLLTVGGKEEDPSMYIPLPFIALIALWFTRRWWWQMRSPFTESLPSNPAQPAHNP